MQQSGGLLLVAGWTAATPYNFAKQNCNESLPVYAALRAANGRPYILRGLDRAKPLSAPMGADADESLPVYAAQRAAAIPQSAALTAPFTQGSLWRSGSCPFAVPEKIIGLTLILDFFDRCTRCALASPATGGARARGPSGVRRLGAATPHPSRLAPCHLNF